jgi:uncharacterized protein (UPF0254 family)
MEPDSDLDAVLAEGAEKARERARRVLRSVRSAIGIGVGTGTGTGTGSGSGSGTGR